MQLLIFPALLLLISTSNGQNTSITYGTFNPLVNSVILDLPSCEYSNKNASVKIKNVNFNILMNFTVPQCRLKRDLIVISDPTNGNTGTVNVGYQIKDLSENTSYTVWYEIEGTVFSSVTFTTLPFYKDYPNVFRRSGGMVVITVLLSIAMFLLVIGLIAALVLGGRGAK